VIHVTTSVYAIEAKKWAMIDQHPSIETVRAVVNENPLAASQKPKPFLVRHNHGTNRKCSVFKQAASR